VLLGASNVKMREGGMTRRGQLTPAAQGEGTMGLEPDQGGGAGDCFVWFVAFVLGVWLGYGSPHSPPSMCFCRVERPLFTRQQTWDTRMWLSCWWPMAPIFRSRTTLVPLPLACPGVPLCVWCAVWLRAVTPFPPLVFPRRARRLSI